MTGVRIRTAGLALVAAALAACVSAPAQAPAWFVEEDRAADRGYPSLHDVPRSGLANTNAQYWAQQEADVLAAGAALRSHPRGAPASATDDPDDFIESARQELESARQSHTP